MSAGSFLIALAALSIGTYLMRFAGVKLGAAIATKGRRSRAGQVGSVASANPAASASPSTSANPNDQSTSADSTERVTMWMDRATVVLIGAVCATTAVFDGKDIADPARLIGVGAGVLASILRVPMLLAVMIGMAVCAIIRTTGML
ncbi:MAG TPA: AzlD domain-containing protein [Candidatus Brevibacterium intestinavium]|jgi:uncharacterized membrane protein|nr:AzlD domain-containing protein [Candidatus Brevibacterium intestinavium]